MVQCKEDNRNQERKNFSGFYFEFSSKFYQEEEEKDMLLGLLSAAFIGGGLIKDQIEHNQKYYETSRDIHRNNPSELEHRRACDEIIEKHGHSW